MKSFSQRFALLTLVPGLLSINWGFSLPAQAAISCEPGTVSYYPNNSLATCLLVQNVNVQVTSPFSGTANFPCKAKNYIVFDVKGQFNRCELSNEIQISNGNLVKTCPADYKVQVAVSDTGFLSITCSPD